MLPLLASPATSFSISHRTMSEPKLPETKFTCRAPDRRRSSRAYLERISA